MVELNDIKLLPNASRQGDILTQCDLRFAIGKTLYEGVGVALHTLCVGYGSCPDDTKILILKLSPVDGKREDAEGTIMRVAQRIANDIAELEACQ